MKIFADARLNTAAVLIIRFAINCRMRNGRMHLYHFTITMISLFVVCFFIVITIEKLARKMATDGWPINCFLSRSYYTDGSLVD